MIRFCRGNSTNHQGHCQTARARHCWPLAEAITSGASVWNWRLPSLFYSWLTRLCPTGVMCPRDPQSCNSLELGESSVTHRTVSPWQCPQDWHYPEGPCVRAGCPTAQALLHPTGDGRQHGSTAGRALGDPWPQRGEADCGCTTSEVEITQGCCGHKYFLFH